MSSLLTQNQKTFFDAAFNNNILDFNDGTASVVGDTNLVDATNGFDATNATFEIDTNNTAVLTNGSGGQQGSVTLPITTLVGATYQVKFDFITDSYTALIVSLGPSTSYNSSNKVEHGNKIAINGSTLDSPYVASGTTSYLRIHLTSNGIRTLRSN